MIDYGRVAGTRRKGKKHWEKQCLPMVHETDLRSSHGCLPVMLFLWWQIALDKDIVYVLIEKRFLSEFPANILNIFFFKVNIIDKVTWPEFTKALKHRLKSSGKQVAHRKSSVVVGFKNLFSFLLVSHFSANCHLPFAFNITSTRTGFWAGFAGSNLEGFSATKLQHSALSFSICLCLALWKLVIGPWGYIYLAG